MSGESDRSTAAGLVQETVSDAVDADDIESILADESTARAVGRKLGSCVGRELGAILGREFGAVVAIDVRKRKGPRAILSDVATRVVELLKALIRNANIGAVISKLTELGTDVFSENTPDKLSESVLSGGEADEAKSGSTEAEATQEESGEMSEEIGEAAVSELSVDDLQELKSDTYRELLEVMSYRELQSIAKEVGVKANVEQEEMVDRIVDKFSDGGKA